MTTFRTMTTPDPNTPILEAVSEKGTNATVVARTSFSGKSRKSRPGGKKGVKTTGRQCALPPTLSSRGTAGVRKSEVFEGTSDCGESDSGSTKEAPSVASSGEGVSSRSQGLSDSTGEEYKVIEDNMETKPFLLPVLCNDTAFCTAQVDNGCDSFVAVSEKFVQRLGLERFALPNPRQLCTAVKTQRRSASSPGPNYGSDIWSGSEQMWMDGRSRWWPM
ncbi:hypothetical protein E4U11_000568 [Claviceps purpurea]|nr:hypothetical protein E4U11_000568 [Claviceps purpurea]